MYYYNAVYGSTSWLWIAIIVGFGVAYKYNKTEGLKFFAGIVGFWMILDYILPALGTFGYMIRTGFYILLFIGFVISAVMK